MPGASANHLGLDQNDQTFRALGPGREKTSTHLAGLQLGDRRIKMKPATTRSRQKKIIHKSCILHFGHPFGLYTICTMYNYIYNIYSSKSMQVRKR